MADNKQPLFVIYLVGFPEARHETDISALEIIRSIIPEARVVQHTIPYHDNEPELRDISIEDALITANESDVGDSKERQLTSERGEAQTSPIPEIERNNSYPELDDDNTIHSVFDDTALDDATADDDTSVTSAATSDSFSPSAIEKEALGLLSRIQRDARDLHTGQQRRMIVLAGHGFGGFVIKQAMIIDNTSPKFYYRVAFSISSLIFFATPHRATRLLTWEEVLLDMLRAANIDSRGRLSQTLTELVDSISHISHTFYTFAAKYRIVNFIDSKGKDDLDSTRFCSDFEKVVPWPVAGHNGFPFCGVDDLDKLSLLRRHFAPDNLLSVKEASVPGSSGHKDNSIFIRTLQSLSLSRWSLYESRTLLGPDEFSDQTAIYSSYLRRVPWDSVRGDCIEVTGPPGHGKSALVKLISQVFRQESSALVIESVPSQFGSNPISLYQVYVLFLHQIISQRPSLFLSVWNLMAEILHMNLWTVAALHTVLVSIFHHSNDINFLIVIYDLESWPENVQSWWSEIANLFKTSHTSTVTFLLSCRERKEEIMSLKVHPLDLTKRYEKFRSDLIKAKTRTLISQGYGSTSLKEVLPESVKDTIVSRAISFHGSFASTNSYLKRLFRTFTLTSIGAIEKSIAKCPLTESDLYRGEIKHLLRIRPKSVSTWAATVLSWMLLSRRPLRVEELATACAMGSDTSSAIDIQKHISMDIERDLRTHLSSFLVIENRYARIVSPAARQVLCEEQSRLDLNMETDYSMTILCLQYLEIVLDDKWSKLRQNLFIDPSHSHQGRLSRHATLELLDYASQFWPAHFLSVANPDEKLKDRVSRFLMTYDIASRWFTLYRFGTGLWGDVPKNEDKHPDKPEGPNLSTTGNIKEEEAVESAAKQKAKAQALYLARYFGLTSIVPSLSPDPELSRDVKTIHVRNGHSERDALLQKDDPKQLLEYAILADDNALVADLFQADPQEVEHSCPLHLAASSGSFKTVQFLMGAMTDSSKLGLDATGRTPLHMAAICGNDSIIRSLLGKGDGLVDDAKGAGLSSVINAKDTGGETPLIVAVRMGNFAAAMLFTELGANATEVDQLGKTCLHWAVSNCPKAVEPFLKISSGIYRIQDKDGRTALHIAAQYGSIESATAIFKSAQAATDFHGAANVKDERGRRPLHYAAENGHSAITSLLIGEMETAIEEVEDNESNIPAELAAARGHLATLKIMDTEVANNGGRLLVAACGAGQIVVVQYLLLAGVSINGDESTPLIPLSEAASKGHDEVVHLLLRREADINFVDFDRQTPLHHAAKNGMISAVQIFLNSKRRGREAANVNAPDSSRFTPLHLAAKAGHAEIVKLLVDHGANVEASSQESETPLHLAVASPDVVKLLLAANADTNARDIGHRTPLHMAATGKYLDTAKILIEHQADIDVRDDDGHLPVYYSIQQNDLSMVMEILKHQEKDGAGNGPSWDDLQLAVQRSALDVLKYLLKGPPDALTDPSGDKRTLLGVAAQEGSLEVVTYLLECGSDVNYSDHSGKTPLHYGASRTSDNSADVVRLLVEHGAGVSNVDEKENTPLHTAARSGAVDIVSALLDANSSVNALQNSKSTPLYLAAYYGHGKAVKRLLEASADPNIRSSNSWSPLHAAADNKEVVGHLLAYDADINYQKDDGWTTLHLSSSWNYSEVVQLLLENKANPNLLNEDGDTPLGVSLDRKSPNSALVLINHIDSYQIDANKTNTAGLAPVHLAINRGMVAAFKALLREGVDFRAKTDSGKSCLQLAVEKPSLEMLTALLAESKTADSGADWTYQDLLIAYWLAIKNDHTKIVDALVAAKPDLLGEVTEKGFNGLEWYLANTALRTLLSTLSVRFIELGLDPFRRQGDSEISAFELGAVSRYGFKKGFIDACLNRLPEDPREAGFGFKDLRISTEIEKPDIWSKLQSLMEHVSGSVDHDGWNIHHFLYQAAPRHKYVAWQETALQKPTKTPESLVIPPKLEPTDTDVEARVEISSTGLEATFDASTGETERRLRSDFPFPPRKFGLAYYEVQIEKVEPEVEPSESKAESDETTQKDLVISVGFAGEFSDLSAGHPGWHLWSAGYHGDDGVVYQEASTEFRVTSDTKHKFGPGNTVGCGIDYEKEKYFFTLNGEIIGDYTSNVIFRKLYPCIGHRYGAVKLTVNFGATDFVWRGAKKLAPPLLLAPESRMIRRTPTDQIHSPVS